jgi:hypothetical protein
MGFDLSGNNWKPDSEKMGSTDTGDYFEEGYDKSAEPAYSSGMMGSQNGRKEPDGPQRPGMENMGDDGIMMGGIEVNSEIPAGMKFIPSSVPDFSLEFAVASQSSGTFEHKKSLSKSWIEIYIRKWGSGIITGLSNLTFDIFPSLQEKVLLLRLNQFAWALRITLPPLPRARTPPSLSGHRLGVWIDVEEKPPSSKSTATPMARVEISRETSSSTFQKITRKYATKLQPTAIKKG